MELTTVTDRTAVFHDGHRVIRYDGLAPGSAHEYHGIGFSTLARPGGELLARVATVNDVHFGELECGRIDDHPDGPIQRAAPGEAPYPETMNGAAADEIAAAGVDAVIARGDLTADGRPEEFAAFERCYVDRFGERLGVARGNHDAYRGQTDFAGDTLVMVPGLAIAVLDTVIPEHTNGRLTAEQLEWLDTVAAESDRPVIAMGHHPQWTDGKRSPDYFGMNPDDSDALSAVIARRRTLVAYSAGHTHRHRVRWLPSGVPTIEIGCVKDFPGTWGELLVHEGGIHHVVHRISTPETLAWSERCRHLYADFGIDYETYAQGTLAERCFTIAVRS